MGKFKDSPRYCIVSVRVTDEEKAYLNELSRRDQTTITNLMRDAMRSYFPHLTSLEEQRLSPVDGVDMRAHSAMVCSVDSGETSPDFLNTKR